LCRQSSVWRGEFYDPQPSVQTRCQGQIWSAVIKASDLRSFLLSTHLYGPTLFTSSGTLNSIRFRQYPTITYFFLVYHPTIVWRSFLTDNTLTPLYKDQPLNVIYGQYRCSLLATCNTETHFIVFEQGGAKLFRSSRKVPCKCAILYSNMFFA